MHAGRGAKRVELEGFADARGEAAYNVDYCRAAAPKWCKAAQAQPRERRRSTSIRRATARTQLIKGTSEHDYAYNRRVELKTKGDALDVR